MSKFPTYPGFKSYNFAQAGTMYTLDYYLLCQRLQAYMETNRPNVQVLTNHKVLDYIRDAEKNHLVRGVEVVDGEGKKSHINCDAVVLCTGSDIARDLKKSFNLICPVVQVKGYSIDMHTD